MKEKKSRQAGQFRYSITIQQKVKNTTADGSLTESWSVARNTRAKVTFSPSGSKEAFEGGVQLVSTQTVVFEIRKLNSTITPELKRIQYNGDDYDVLRVEQSGLGMQYLAITAEKRDNE